jgi:archaellum biogenesis ATPase FlaH
VNNVFEYLQTLKLQDTHFNAEIEFLIPDFLPKKLITMYYADGGNGKSWLAQAITNHLLDEKKVAMLTYIDFDNPVSILKDRNIYDLLIKKHKNLNYIQRSTLNMPPFDLLLKLEEHAYNGAYEDCVFMIDSLRNVVDIMHDGKVMRVMDALMNIREAGATIVLLHHSNKDGRNYQGSNNIRNSIDCMYRLDKRPSQENEINFLLEVQKERAGIKDRAFCVKTKELSLQEMDFDIACMNEYELEFVEKVKKALTLYKEGLNKTELLENTGHKKDDKTARDTLDKFTDKFWKSKKAGNKYVYSLG